MHYQSLFGIAALASAASWALGSVLWRKIGDEISPYSMNLSKGIIGIFYLAIALLVIGIEPITSRDFIYLGLSGFFGITLGDTFFFKSLMKLGPRLASLTGTLTPVFIALSAVVFLGERPSLLVWTGIFITMGGVAWVLKERIPQNDIVPDKSLGIKYRLLAVIFMTAGVIFAKIGVTAVPTIQATIIRLSCGVIGLVIWGCLNRQLKGWLVPFKDKYLLGKVFLIVFLVVFGGFWLSLLALKYIDASVASTLNSTSPLFILPIVAILLKEKVSMKAVLGAAVAVGGVALIFMGG